MPLQKKVHKINHSLGNSADPKDVYMDKMILRLFSNLPGFAYKCSFDKNWTMQFVSEGSKSVTGYEAEEIIANKVISYGKIIHPDDRKQVYENVEKGFEMHKHFEMEYRILTKEGELRWVWERGICIRDEKGKPVAIQGYITDISDRKFSEQKIIESEKEYRQLVDLSPDGIVILDLKGHIKKVNKAFCQMSGYEKEHFEDKHIFKIPTAIKADFKVYINLLDRLIFKSTEDPVHFKWKNKKGETRLSEGRAIKITVRNKSYIMGLVRDITNIDKEKNEIIKAKVKAEALLNASPDMMFVFDAKGTIIDYKSDQAELYLQQEDLVLKNIFNILPKDLVQKTRENIAKTLSTHQMHIYTYSLDIPGKGTCHYEARMVESGQNEVTSIIRDITDQITMNENLLMAKEKAEESDRLKSAFLANMSHEIRTPMNAIVGFSNLLTRTNDDETRMNYIDLIKKSSDYLLHLINDVLFYSRLQSEKIPVVSSRIDCRGFIQDLYDTFKMTNNKAGLELLPVLDPNYENIYIMGDREKIWEIMSIFISNALKYTEKGQVAFGYTVDKDRIEFFVKDTGIGIPEKEQQHIFDRFYRAESVMTSHIRGTGLGLSIAEGLVKVLDGNIGVNSAPGKGSTFYFDIFLEVAPRPIVEKEEPKTLPKNLKDFKVLIAEDDDFNYLYIYELIKDCVKKIEHAKDGREAVNMAFNNEYDLIFMDVKMPVMNGLDAIKAIKKRYPLIPIIAQTAYAQPEEKDEIMAVGANAYLTKPIYQNKLKETVNKVCNAELC